MQSLISLNTVKYTPDNLRYVRMAVWIYLYMCLYFHKEAGKLGRIEERSKRKYENIFRKYSLLKKESLLKNSFNYNVVL